MQFVEIDCAGTARTAGYAPYLDYRPLTDEERALVAPLVEKLLATSEIGAQASSYAISNLVPAHFEEVRERREELVRKTMAAVKDRLTKEINYWDHRAEELKLQELAGRVNARINSGKARQRADELQVRLQKRMEELEQERLLSPLPPVVIGGALIIPAGLLAKLRGESREALDHFARETKRSEEMAMAAVMEAERRLGFDPKDVSDQKCGYDIESRVPATGKLRFIEVKGRMAGATTVTITKNEILAALNKPNDFVLAIAEVDGDVARLRYVRRPFQQEPDFAVTSVNYNLEQLLFRGEDPC
jgi:hypothetical protein